MTLRLHHSFSLSFLIFLVTIITLPLAAQQQPSSPAEYLGYELGEQWTPHYKVLGYFRHVAESSPMVELEQYGKSNEGRELVIAKIGSERNISRLEQIRTDNLKRAGLIEGEPSSDKIPIVWLSYNVHGNETSSSEAAMKTIYELVRPDNSETKEWLQNTVVIMDPMINPDGRDRYVHWYRETVGDEINVHIDAREHHEPWPGGRTNHYYFDLNRDWAWVTQKESRQRIDIYQQWLPHIHVDYHEQSYNDPYYFAPAAEPFHEAITDWQREFQFTIGKNHAGYFDKNDWLYFTREVFDLFYPSYGDTYPIFNGAIGMTYEQGGHSLAGRGIITADGDTLTLKDRLTHHFVTGLSTVEITSKHADRVVSEFETYFENAQNNPDSEYKSFIINSENDPDKLRALFKLLDRHQVKYGLAPRSRTYNGYNYQTGREERVDVSEEDYVISVYQPKAILARVFFEPRPHLVDSLTYDITAWEQHYAFGLNGYALKDRINPVDASFDTNSYIGNENLEKPYAYIAEWKTLDDLRLLARLLNAGIKVRYADDSFTIDGREYDPGTLVITRNGNKQMGDSFDKTVRSIAGEMGQSIFAVATGFVEDGHDFGSDAVVYIEAPNVLLLSGEGTSSNMVGEIWHFFDRQINYPITIIDKDDLNRVDMARYQVMIMPSGFYRDLMDDNSLKDLKDWISSGGRLIAVQGANSQLAGKDGFSLKRKESEEEEEDTTDQIEIYNQRQRESIQRFNTGSVFKVTMDPTHPLGFGYERSYFSLKLDASAYEYLENGWNVGVAQEDAHMSGFVGNEAKDKLEKTLVFGVQNMGRGEIVYMIDNPLFRAFWYNGKLLFGNAVFMVGQ